MADTTTPIEVNPSQIPGGAATLLRYALTALGTMLVTKQILPANSDIGQIVGGIMVIASTGYGLWKTYSNKSKLVVTAEAAPDHVAVVKP